MQAGEFFFRGAHDKPGQLRALKAITGRINWGDSSAQRRSASESFQIAAGVLPRTTAITVLPCRLPLATRHFPEARVVPVFMPVAKGKRFKSLLVFVSLLTFPLLWMKS